MANFEKAVDQDQLIKASENYTRDGTRQLLEDGEDALGGLLLGVFSDVVLIPALAVILLVSAVKLARHD
ncbi:hypothetical protein [Streptomyces niveus]|uniref:hypothetical protein n=1 Tax=Streptomyces niveus TaxID=193462 RepID=UPI003447AF69